MVASPQVIATFNRVRMLTQDWGVIVEALTNSPVVEVGAGGALLRAREGWAAWVLPPEQRDKTAHAPSAASSLAGSAVQTPLQSPQRPRAVSVRPGAVQASEIGPAFSTAPVAAHRSEPDSDAGQSAGDMAPAMRPDQAATAATAAKRDDGEQPGAAAAALAGEDTSSASLTTAASGQGETALALTTAPIADGGVEAAVESQSAQPPEGAHTLMSGVRDEPEAPAQEAPASATSAGAAQAGQPTGRDSAAAEDTSVPRHSTIEQQTAPESESPGEQPAGTTPEQSDAAAIPPPLSRDDGPPAAEGGAPASATCSVAAASMEAPRVAATARSVQGASDELGDDMFQLDEVRDENTACYSHL